MTQQIELGIAIGGEKIFIDLSTLVSTRLLVTASSGGGKSETLRRILEEAVDHIQCVVIDPEGEFSTLREKKPFVLVGEGGEAIADIRTAGLLATRLLELNASAVCDLYEMRVQNRHEWVKRFLDAMVNAPKSLWHPVLVILDEAHQFAPEKGYGESVATQSVIDLANLGRKRGFCLIPATQRLSKLSKNVVEPMQNYLVGRTTFDDQARASSVFKIAPGASTRAFSLELERLKDGQFFARGRAITGDMLKVQVTRGQTRPPVTGTAMAGVVTATPEAIKAMLPKLADLPHEAEKKAKTEEDLLRDIASAKKQIADLEQKLESGELSKEREQMLVEQIQKMEDELSQSRRAIAEFESVQLGLRSIASKLGELADMANSLAAQSTVDDQTEKAISTPIAAKTSTAFFIEEKLNNLDREVPKRDGADLNSAHIKILVALAKLHAVGITNPERIQLAFFAGYSNAKSGGFAGPLAQLIERNYAQAGNGCVSIMPSGLRMAGKTLVPVNTAELHIQLRDLLGSSEWKLLEVIIRNYPRSIERVRLADLTGYSNAKSGGFAGPLARLTSLGLTQVPAPGMVAGTELLFINR